MSDPTTLAALAIAVQAGVPVLLWGMPGTGKSSAIMGLAKALNWPIEVVIASLREPADFAGLPVVKPDGVVLYAPSWAHRLQQVERGVLFLDEISTAAPAVQAALLRVVLERVVGDMALPEGISIIAAANPPEYAAGGWDMAPPLGNRFCHLEWSLSAKDWAKGVVNGWDTAAPPELPATWQNLIPQTTRGVASFVSARPQLICQPPGPDGKPLAWPSPRTWSMSARLAAACAAAEVKEGVAKLLLSGCVGRGPGTELAAFLLTLDLGDPAALLGNPKSLKLPRRSDQQYALLSGVVETVKQANDINAAENAWQVLIQAKKQGADGDVLAPLCTMLTRVTAALPSDSVQNALAEELVPAVAEVRAQDAMQQQFAQAQLASPQPQLAPGFVNDRSIRDAFRAGYGLPPKQ